MSAGHLVKRFFGSVVRRSPRPADAAWAEAQLLPGEIVLWRRMSKPDQCHAAGVARRVQRALGEDATRPVLAAALLHDVGKIDSGLGTCGRVIATLSANVAGRSRVAAGSDSGGFTGQVGLYLRHAELGGVLLQRAGSDPLTVSWAREHHLDEQQWTVPAAAGRPLKAADDD